MSRAVTLQDLQAQRLVIPLKSPCGGPKGLLLSQLKRSSAQSGAQKNADQFGPGRTLAGTPESTSTPEPSLGETTHPSGPGRTLASTLKPISTPEATLGETAHPSSPDRTLTGTQESASTPEPSLGEITHPSGPGRTLTSTLEPISTLEALGETPHPGQQNGFERLANFPSESQLLGPVSFGDNNTNCGNTTGSYNKTTNNNTTNRNKNTITNNAEKIYGGGTHNTISGSTFN